MKLEEIEKLVDDSADAIAYQEEVSQMLQSSLTDQDEDEIEKEFAKLEAETSIKNTINLPSVPKHPIVIPEQVKSQPLQEPGEEEEMVVESDKEPVAMLAQ